MSSEMLEFNKKLKELRKEHNYTQEYVAWQLEITQQTYQQYESGKARPEYERLIKLANLYDVSIDYLLGNEKGNDL